MGLPMSPSLSSRGVYSTKMPRTCSLIVSVVDSRVLVAVRNTVFIHEVIGRGAFYKEFLDVIPPCCTNTIMFSIMLPDTEAASTKRQMQRQMLVVDEEGAGGEPAVGCWWVVVFCWETTSFLIVARGQESQFHGCTCQRIASKTRSFHWIPRDRWDTTKFLKSHFLVGSEQAKSQFGFATRQKAEKLCSDPSFLCALPSGLSVSIRIVDHLPLDRGHISFLTIHIVRRCNDTYRSKRVHKHLVNTSFLFVLTISDTRNLRSIQT